MRYKLNRKLSFSFAYDTRKRIIYYETFRSEIERLLADDEARQGLRLRINFRPFSYVNAGLGVSRRFQNSSNDESNNINGYVSHSKLPGIQGSLTLRANTNRSSYLESKIASLRYSRRLYKQTVRGDFYFRYVAYNYRISELKSDQQYYGASLSIRINRDFRISVLGELATRDHNNNYRINTKLIKRLSTKK